MNKPVYNGWLFVYFIQSERRFGGHTIAVSSFYQALKEHIAVFPTHNVVFALQVPLYLAEYTSKQLQACFVDSERIFSEFSRSINTPMQSLVVS